MEPASERLADATRLPGIVSGSSKIRAAYVAARLRIADHLAAGPMQADELAAATGAHQVLSPGITEFLS